MCKKRYIISVGALVISAALLLTSVYAWFTISTENRFNGVFVAVGKYDVDITFFIRQSDAQDYGELVNSDSPNYEIIDNAQKIREIIGRAVVGDTIEIKAVLKNNSGRGLLAAISATGVASAQLSNYNMLDVFYVQDGAVRIVKMLGEEVLSDTTALLTPLSAQAAVKYGFTLNNYRLSNLAGESGGNFKLVANERLPAYSITEIDFALCYDQNSRGPGKEQENVPAVTFSYFLLEFS